MKKLSSLLFISMCLLSVKAFSQQKGHTQAVKPGQMPYHALYVLNESDDKKIRGILRNINNALNDPRLKNKLHIELIAFSDGVEIYKKANDYLSLLLPLKEQGVIFAQCSRTMEERKIEKNELYDFVEYVPSGNGEIILKQHEGWAIVHP